jgi:hypothetical protein
LFTAIALLLIAVGSGFGPYAGHHTVAATEVATTTSLHAVFHAGHGWGPAGPAAPGDAAPPGNPPAPANPTSPTPTPPNPVPGGRVPAGSPSNASPSAVAPGDGGGGGGASAPWWDIKAQTAGAINSWLSAVVAGAMAPVAQVSGSLLDPRRLTAVSALRQLWGNSRAVANGLFGLLILVGALVVAGHETVQTRWALKQIAPRIVVGFCAANLSWSLISASIGAAAALAVAVAGNGMTPSQILTAVLTASAAGGPIFTVILQLVLVVLAVALVICLVVVGVLLMLLTVTAPLALCLHALPQTEQIAYLWWRALAATLAIPVLQGLILALLARVVLAPGGYALLGIGPLLGGASTLLNLIVTLALLWIMISLPGRMWRLATGRGARRGGLVRGLVKTAVSVAALSGLGGPAGAVLGRVAAGGRGMRAGRALSSFWAATHANPNIATAPRRRPPSHRAPHQQPRTLGGTATATGHGPRTRTRQRPTGQSIPPSSSRVAPPRRTPPQTGSRGGPMVGRDGQYELHLDLPTTFATTRHGTGRAAHTDLPHSNTGPSTGAKRNGRQLSLFSRERLLGQPPRPRGGQLALPLTLTARPPQAPPTAPPAGASAPAASPARRGGRQMSLFSPAALRAEPVAGADGQYRLRIPLTRTHRPPAPVPPPPAARPAPRQGSPGWQITLPPYPLARPHRRPRPPAAPSQTSNPDPDSGPDSSPRRPR